MLRSEARALMYPPAKGIIYMLPRPFLEQISAAEHRSKPLAVSVKTH
jgi:hypothetical protein